MRFAQLIAQGETNRAAYLSAGYSTASETVADSNAARLLADARVKALVLALRQEQWRASCLQNSERRSILGKIARMDPAGKPTHGQVVQAIREDAILAGERQADNAVALQVNLAIGEAISALGGVNQALEVESIAESPCQIADAGRTHADLYAGIGEGPNAGLGLSQPQPKAVPISAEQSPLEQSAQPLSNPLEGLAGTIGKPDADPVEAIDRTFARPWLEPDPSRTEGLSSKPPYGGLDAQPFDEARAQGPMEDLGDD